MKRKILTLGATLACLVGLTACGTAVNTVAGSDYDESVFTSDYILQIATSIEDGMLETFYANGVTPDNFEDVIYDSLTEYYGEEVATVFENGYSSWYEAIDDIGYGSAETLASDLSVTSLKEYSVNNKGQLIVQSTIESSANALHTATMEIMLDEDAMPTSIAVNVNYSTPERLSKAGLNTLMGMGMAFFVLILVSIIISIFPKLMGMANKPKKEEKKDIATQAIDNTISQIEQQEDLSSDAELVAVIAAAIASYEGTSTEGFQVRSIRKVNKNWKKA
ncbi:MAG: OadG family protein [Butyrivibrio sp.]|nr:OadG family protein [Butyrivibrio sp.]